MNDQAQVLLTKLETIGQHDKLVDIYPLIGLCTLDIICEKTMGRKVNAQGSHNSPYVEALQETTQQIFISLAVERLDVWSDATPSGRQFYNNFCLVARRNTAVVSAC